MKSFAQKVEAVQQTRSVTHTAPVRADGGPSHGTNSILQLQRLVGNQAVERLMQRDTAARNTVLLRATRPRFGYNFSQLPVTAGAIQTKLVMNKPGDTYEQEADRVAEEVMRMQKAPIESACACGGAHPKEQAEAHGKGRQGLQTKQIGAGDLGQTEAPPSVQKVLRSPGQPLDRATRAFMETQLAYDFSSVRVHADKRASYSARDIAANAYTVGNHIVFGAGQLNPGSSVGRRLLAHELTHVIQQGHAGRLSLQRDKRKDKAQEKERPKQAAPAAREQSSDYFHLVVRDRGLDLGGGVLVSDLTSAKKTLMKRKVDKPWTLVLAIHASENLLGAQSPPDWQKNAIFYDESAIKTLFGGDSAFVTWRDQFGPNRVVLYGCQVTAAFEQTIANNLARGGKAPSAGGLGEGCKPLATTITFQVKSQREYNKLDEQEKEQMRSDVQAINQTWGYYGGPPVPDEQVLDYLFKGPKPGSWPQVEVIVKQGNQYVSAKPPIPYWNRRSNSIYLRQCTKAVGNLREHKPQAPRVRERE